MVVIGGGSSATDLAGLLKDSGADGRAGFAAGGSEISWRPRRSASRVRSGRTFTARSPGIGPGWRLRFFANAPNVFYYLPESLRLEAVRRVLGPSGPWFMKERVIGRVPLALRLHS